MMKTTPRFVAILLTALALSACTKTSCQNDSLFSIPGKDDLDGDCIVNSDDKLPLTSQTPIIALTAGDTFVGIRYRISGSSEASTTSAITSTSRFNTNYVYKSEQSRTSELTRSSTDKVAVSIGGNKISPSINGDKASSSIDGPKVSSSVSADAATGRVQRVSDSFVQSSSNEQARGYEQTRLFQVQNSEKLSWESNGGYIQSNIVVDNASSSPVILSDVFVSVVIDQLDGSVLPVITGARLRKSSTMASSGFNNIDGKDVKNPESSSSFTVAPNRNARPNLIPVLFEAISVDLIFNRLARSNVRLQIDDYKIELGGKVLSKAEHDKLNEEAVNSLIAVVVKDDTYRSHNLLAPLDESGKPTNLLTGMRTVIGKFTTKDKDGQIYLTQYRGKPSDLTWSSLQDLKQSNRNGGRWVVTVNGNEATPKALNEALAGGDNILIEHVENINILRQFYEPRTTSFTSDWDGQNLTSVSSGVATMEGVTSARALPARVCSNISVKNRDIVTLKVRTSLSKAELVQRKPDYVYPSPGRGFTVNLASVCQAVELRPSAEMTYLNRGEASGPSQVSVSFGEHGPSIPMSELITWSGKSGQNYTNDGTLQVRFSIPQDSLSQSQKLCFDIPRVYGLGLMTRTVRAPEICTGEGLNLLFCRGRNQKCGEWVAEFRPDPDQRYPRHSKSEIDATVLQSMEDSH